MIAAAAVSPLVTQDHRDDNGQAAAEMMRSVFNHFSCDSQMTVRDKHLCDMQFGTSVTSLLENYLQKPRPPAQPTTTIDDQPTSSIRKLAPRGHAKVPPSVPASETL